MECASTLEGNLHEIFFVDKPIHFLQHERTYWGLTVNDITVVSLDMVDVASRCKKTDIVHSLLRCTTEINTNENEKFTVLHYASYLGSKNIVEDIAKAGADINAQSATKDTALHFATIQGHYEIVLILIENGAECNIQNEKEWSSLMLATATEGNDCLHLLIKAGVDVNLQDKEGKAALHYASLSKGSEKVKALIEAGADINILSSAGDTALHYAALSGSKRSVNLLIRSGIGINTENHSGQTALHLSLRQYNFKVFETLLKNDASICIRDKEEYDPLRNMFKNKRDYLLQIFKLQHYLQSYTDVYGNTILHLLVENFWEQPESFKELWDDIVRNYTEFSIYLPKQNMFKQTIFHIAATKGKRSSEILPVIFLVFQQYLQDVLLLKDENGNTFLHTYLNTSCFEISFSDFLPENETVKQKLLASRNYVGNTLLHIAYVVSEFEIILPNSLVPTCSILEIVGATINSKNNLGETGFQRFIYFHKKYPELTRAVMEKGPKKDVQNIFGETELFIVPSFGISMGDRNLFSKLKSDITVRNRIGQTMIMANPYEWFSWISTFKSKTFLNQQDIFRNNVLHYIACDEEIETLFSTNDLSEDKLAFISEVSVNEDELSQLPCDVALLRGHIHILEHICVCKNGVHKKKPVFFDRFLYINSMKQTNQSFENCVRSLSGYFTERTIENIISEPFIGLIQFKKDKNDTDMDSFDKEATEVKNVIEKIVKKICTRLSEKEKLFANEVILSGSVGEDTKVGLPNEFDFICLLVEMSNWLVIEETEGNGVQLKLKKEYRHGKCSRFFNPLHDGFKDINDRFYAIITEILQEPEIYSHQNLFRKGVTLSAPTCGPNFTLKFKWCCCKYKNMTVKIDLVPSFQIPHETKLLSSNFNLVKNNSKFVMGREKSSTNPWYVSAVNEENERYATLSSEAKKAYVISKILCSKRVCPIVICDKTRDIKGRKEICEDVISSYMLKNCLFHVAEETQGNSISNFCVHDYVCRIFQKLLHFCRQETLPIFMFRNINLFEYSMQHAGLEEDCLIRAMYVKLILNILGKNYDFDDINLDYTTDEFENRKVVNFIEDKNICAQCQKTPGRDRITLTACTKCKLWTYCSDTCKNCNEQRHKSACDYHYRIILLNAIHATRWCNMQPSSDICRKFAIFAYKNII